MSTRFAVYLLKRTVMAFLTIFLVIAITFFTMHAIPASPFSSEKAKNDATIAALEKKYGFDKPVTVQFLNYLGNVVQFDFGLSTGWVGSTVSDLISNSFQYSATIGLTAAVIAIIFGVLLGAIAAIKRGHWLDKIIQVVTTALVSMPSFVIATLLLFIFGLLPEMVPHPGQHERRADFACDFAQPLSDGLYHKAGAFQHARRAGPGFISAPRAPKDCASPMSFTSMP